MALKEILLLTIKLNNNLLKWLIIKEDSLKLDWLLKDEVIVYCPDWLEALLSPRYIINKLYY